MFEISPSHHIILWLYLLPRGFYCAHVVVTVVEELVIRITTTRGAFSTQENEGTLLLYSGTLFRGTHLTKIEKTQTQVTTCDTELKSIGVLPIHADSSYCWMALSIE